MPALNGLVKGQTAVKGTRFVGSCHSRPTGKGSLSACDALNRSLHNSLPPVSRLQEQNGSRTARDP